MGTRLEPPHDQTCRPILANRDYYPPQFLLNLYRSQLIRTLDLQALMTFNSEIVLSLSRRTCSQSTWDFPSCSPKFFLSSSLIDKTKQIQRNLKEKDWEGYDLLPDHGCDTRKPTRSCSQIATQPTLFLILLWKTDRIQDGNCSWVPVKKTDYRDINA